MAPVGILNRSHIQPQRISYPGVVYQRNDITVVLKDECRKSFRLSSCSPRFIGEQGLVSAPYLSRSYPADKRTAIGVHYVIKLGLAAKAMMPTSCPALTMVVMLVSLDDSQ